MITIRLMGGLGNQLFQVSGMIFLRSLGRSARCDTTSWFEARDPSDDTRRAFEVGGLLRRSERCRLSAGLARALYSPRNPRAFFEHGPGDDLLRRLPPRWAWATGYYQRADYLIRIQDELEKRLTTVLDRLPPDTARVDVIGVHVRLGDYVSNRRSRAHHGLTSAGYFGEAVGRVRRDTGDLPIRVFTDSPEIVGSGILGGMTGAVEISEAAGSWETLRQLSSCSAIVMSNSSFSWWAAFIANVLRGREIPVVMPAPWFAAASPADDLLHVAGWHQLPRTVSAP